VNIVPRPELHSEAARHDNPARSAVPASKGLTSSGVHPGKQTSTAPPVDPESAVTLQKDSDGRFYYLVTDARTGQPVLEFPPEVIRNVGQGIEQYLQQHARRGEKLEVKA
jgi:hypothetical protein